MTYKPGPKELAQRAMRERWAADGETRTKTSAAELREKVEEIKKRPPKPKKKPKGSKT